MLATAENRIPTLNYAAPEHILVATDLTDCNHLVPYVVSQAKASNAKVTLVHAAGVATPFPIQVGSLGYIGGENVEHDARAALLEMSRQIEAEGVSCDVQLQHGVASEVIREALLDTGATRLIIATHGRGKLGQFVLGSVAKELLKTVDVPIFAVGPGVPDSADHAMPRKILHPVSLDGDFQKSVDFAVALAEGYGAELTLLHVMTLDFAGGGSERSLTWAKNALSELIPRDAKLAQPVQFITGYGKVTEEILNAATHIGADWIVLGVDAHVPGWSFNDSMAYRVLAAANCPVCTIHHQPLAAAEAAGKAADQREMKHGVEVLG